MTFNCILIIMYKTFFVKLDNVSVGYTFNQNQTQLQ
jgi:hypothetical protein